MPRQFSEYTGQFFWDFKRMDNVNYNFEILEKLYEIKKQQKTDLLNKPITITIISMMECMLYDFIIRIKGHIYDKIPNLSQDIIDEIKDKYCEDVFGNIIAQVRKQDLLLASSSIIYDNLEQLRKIRNRIHIQNSKYELAADENSVFIDDNLNLAQNMFERICEILCNVYPRWGMRPIPMVDFPRPWL